MMQNLYFLLLVVAIFINGSCIDTKKTTLAKLTKSPVSIETLDGHWKVTEINGKGIESEMEKPSLDFVINENRISGFTSCNRLLGKFDYHESHPEVLRFGSMGTTMMACPDADVEAEFLNALNRVNRFGELKNRNTFTIVLCDSLDTPLLFLER